MEIVTLIVLAFAVSAISLTITKSGISQEFRDWIKPLGRKKFLRKVVELFHCPFCMSFWVSLVLLTWYKRYPVSVDLLIYSLVLMGMSSLISALIFHFMMKD